MSDLDVQAIRHRAELWRGDMDSVAHSLAVDVLALLADRAERQQELDRLVAANRQVTRESLERMGKLAAAEVDREALLKERNELATSAALGVSAAIATEALARLSAENTPGPTFDRLPVPEDGYQGHQSLGGATAPVVEPQESSLGTSRARGGGGETNV